MAKIPTNISIDADIKAKAQELFAELGLDLSTAVNIFLRQAVREEGMPFDVSSKVPNATTIAAMEEFEDMKRNPAGYKRYSTFKAAMNEVLQDA